MHQIILNHRRLMAAYWERRVLVARARRQEAVDGGHLLQALRYAGEVLACIVNARAAWRALASEEAIHDQRQLWLGQSIEETR